MFPNDLYIVDSVDGTLYKVDNNVVKPIVKINNAITTATIGNETSITTAKEICSILVSQNQSDIYTVNRNDNSVTRIHNGKSLGDIRVGNSPYAICEDPNGILYVTNYADNTVTVIQNNIADNYPILVDKGPRGIVSDSNGTIWVACYLSNTVVKIVNHTVVDSIPVGFNPEGITCDIQNNIWVTCAGSNIVCKITRGKKVLTKDTGKRPVAVVTDRNLNVYVANFEDDTVTMISNSGEMASTVIPVGDGPTAITVDQLDYIYVVSNLSGEDVKKISPKTKKVIDSIHVCKSPAAFGDFSGCATWNVFNPAGTSNGIAENAEAFLSAINPTFKVTSLDETNTTCTFGIDSDLVDFSKFDHVLLNNTQPNSDGKYVLENLEIGSYLQVKGYFTATNTSPITFKTVPYKNVFPVKLGMVDTEFDNYQECYTKIVDFNNHDIVACVLPTPIEGYVVVMVPKRIYTISKDYLTVNSGYNFGNAWKVDESEGTDENLEKIKASGISADDKAHYEILYNPVISEKASLFFFHLYKTES